MTNTQEVEIAEQCSYKCLCDHKSDTIGFLSAWHNSNCSSIISNTVKEISSSLSNYDRIINIITTEEENVRFLSNALKCKIGGLFRLATCNSTRHWKTFIQKCKSCEDLDQPEQMCRWMNRLAGIFSRTS